MSRIAEFSIQDVAFTGFRVVREHPRALLAWGLYALALSLVVSVIFVRLAGADFMKLMAFGGQPTLDPAEAMALFGRLAPVYACLLIVGLASNAVLGAAMIRTVLRPADDRFGYLRLGADEWRQLGLGVLMILVLMGVYLGLVILIGVVVGVVSLAAKGAAAVALAVMLVGLAGVMLVLIVRLSLAPALTFDTHHIGLQGSWNLTRGRFWPLFGTYLLAFAMVAVVYLLSLLLIFAVGAILNGGNPAAAMSAPDMGTLKSYLTPATLAQTVLSAGASALVWPVFFTPSAAIYRILAPAARNGEAVA